MDLLERARKYYINGDFDIAVKHIELKLEPENKSYKRLQQIKADSLLELGEFEQALETYRSVELFSHAGFAAVMMQDLELAKSLYLQAPLSSAQKWGLFLYDFLTNPKRLIPNPGWLTFRLYFEASLSYFLRFKLEKYSACILGNRKSLAMIYPDLEREIERANKFLK